MSSSGEFLKHGAHYTYEFLLSIECFIPHALRRSLLTVISVAQKGRRPAYQSHTHRYNNKEHEAMEQLAGTTVLLHCWNEDYDYDDDDDNNRTNNYRIFR